MSRTGPGSHPDGGRSWVAGAVSAVVTLLVIAVVAIAAAIWSYAAPGPRRAARVRHDGAPAQGRRRQRDRRGPEARRGDPLRRDLHGRRPAHRRTARLKAGEYCFPPRASLRQGAAQAAHGDIVHHRVTIPEGTTSQQAVDILPDRRVLTGSIPPPPRDPAARDLRRGARRAARGGAAADDGRCDKLLAQLWAKRRPGLPFTDPQQAIPRPRSSRRRPPARRAPAGGRRLHQPAAPGHAAGRRSDGDLRPAPAARRWATACAPLELQSNTLQHLSQPRPAARADRQSGPGPRWRR